MVSTWEIFANSIIKYVNIINTHSTCLLAVTNAVENPFFVHCCTIIVVFFSTIDMQLSSKSSCGVITIFRMLCIVAVMAVVIVYKLRETVTIPQLISNFTPSNTSVIQTHPLINQSTSEVKQISPVGQNMTIFQTNTRADAIQHTSPLLNQSTSEIKEARSPPVGYMIVLDFADQATGAFLNLVSLMCLSSAVGGVRVVEPFLSESIVGLNVSANWRDEVRLSDVFDSSELNHYAKSRGLESLVPFETFLKGTPRKLLIAQYRCKGYHVCRTCGHEDVLEQGRMFARLNGFEMVGHVCLDYGSSASMNFAEFKRQLYSKYSKSEVVVMFPLFGGVAGYEGHRLNVRPSRCHRGVFLNVEPHIKPSKLAITSAENYIDKFLGGSNQYMSVMVRFEMVLGSKSPAEINDCFIHLKAKVNEVKSKFNMNKVVLCLDVGKYGSLYLHYKSTRLDNILPQVNSFISQSVQEGLNLTGLDRMFTDTSLKPNAGFVAVMQKALAARGEVLVLLGDRSRFQLSTESMYKTLHKNWNIVKLGKSCE